MQPNQILPGFQCHEFAVILAQVMPVPWKNWDSSFYITSKIMVFIHLMHVLGCVQGQTWSPSTLVCKSEYWLQETQGTAHHWKLFRLVCHSHICIKNDLMNNFVPGLCSYIFNKMNIYSNLSILQYSVLIMYQNYGMFSVLTHHLTKLTGSFVSVMNLLSFIPYISPWCKFL